MQKQKKMYKFLCVCLSGFLSVLLSIGRFFFFFLPNFSSLVVKYLRYYLLKEDVSNIDIFTKMKIENKNINVREKINDR